MNRLVALVRFTLWQLAVRGHVATEPGQCPARIFCLGCDGNINCALARSVVARGGR